MAVVVFSSELQLFTGEERTEVGACRFKEIVAELVEKYEALTEDKLMEMAVAIDGEIIHTPFLETVGDQSELHFLHRISGG
ncbi:MAG: hypothetical protein ISP91_09835 [Pseudomonadales bacterium]|jgi:hypothetical protein|nr:hypothetical protein [Pseudomonadales bacterium]